MASSVETSSVTERHTGRVKWFNSKTGYGFVTVTDGTKSGTDVFVHHSSVQVEKEQYRYLVQGEYVQFGLTRMTEGPHEYQATHVTGVNGGQLMCESLLESGRQVRAYKPRPQYQEREAPRRTETLPPMPREDTRRQTTTSFGGRGNTSGRETSSGRGTSSGRVRVERPTSGR
jgi:CspA family cold shock protein